MKISKAGIDLIKKWEGFRNHPYLDPIGIPTIGWGFIDYPNGRKVTMMDNPLSREDAEVILWHKLEVFESGVCGMLQQPVTQNQFDALVSFAYNLGLGALRRSTLLRKLNKNPNDPKIDFEFKRWVFAGGEELKGLRKRRNQEAWLYFEHIRKQEEQAV